MIIIAILIIISLVVLVMVLYVVNRKTPLPKGCEDLKLDEDKCRLCSNAACGMKKFVKGDIDENQEK